MLEYEIPVTLLQPRKTRRTTRVGVNENKHKESQFGGWKNHISEEEAKEIQARRIREARSMENCAATNNRGKVGTIVKG